MHLDKTAAVSNILQRVWNIGCLIIISIECKLDMKSSTYRSIVNFRRFSNPNVWTISLSIRHWKFKSLGRYVSLITLNVRAVFMVCGQCAEITTYSHFISFIRDAKKGREGQTSWLIWVIFSEFITWLWGKSSKASRRSHKPKIKQKLILMCLYQIQFTVELIGTIQGKCKTKLKIVYLCGIWSDIVLGKGECQPLYK